MMSTSPEAAVTPDANDKTVMSDRLISGATLIMKVANAKETPNAKKCAGRAAYGTMS